ncbi:hypothetical protein V5799_027952 [Amblyomma americanum]|uniref:M13 family peptidase n=1 Tax=Amblyomma americanum TaxID=6943 RepID=A0AAQ4DE91_AMBAM
MSYAICIYVIFLYVPILRFLNKLSPVFNFRPRYMSPGSRFQPTSRQRRHHQKVEALAECESPDCAPELRYLDAVVQANVNPCADFYGHVCYRWTEQHAGEGFLKDAFDRFFRILAGRVLQAPASGFGDKAEGADNLTYLVERTTSVLDRAFPASYVALRLATHRETVLVAPPEAAEADTARLWAHQWPVYREPHGNVILPVPYLERPLMYAVSSNAEVNYATVGVAVAKALSEAVGPYSRWNVSSSETLWESDASFSYSILAGCLRSHADPYIISHPDEPPPTRSSVYKASVFAWMRSARAALDALRDHIWSEKMTDDRWIRAQRVFFKRFCLLSCGSERTDPMSPLERCTWPLLSMPEFRNVFHCSNSTFERYDSSCVAF